MEALMRVSEVAYTIKEQLTNQQYIDLMNDLSDIKDNLLNKNTQSMIENEHEDNCPMGYGCSCSLSDKIDLIIGIATERVPQLERVIVKMSLERYGPQA